MKYIYIENAMRLRALQYARRRKMRRRQYVREPVPCRGGVTTGTGERFRDGLFTLLCAARQIRYISTAIGTRTPDNRDGRQSVNRDKLTGRGFRADRGLRRTACESRSRDD